MKNYISEEMITVQEGPHILVPAVDLFSYQKQGFKNVLGGYRINIGKIGYVVMTPKILPEEWKDILWQLGYSWEDGQLIEDKNDLK